MKIGLHKVINRVNMIQLIFATIIMLRDVSVPLIYHYLNMATMPNNGTTKQKPRLDLNGYSSILRIKARQLWKSKNCNTM